MERVITSSRTGYQNFSGRKQEHLIGYQNFFTVGTGYMYHNYNLCPAEQGIRTFQLISGCHNFKVQRTWYQNLTKQGIRTCQLTSPVGSQLQSSGIRTSLPRYQNFSAHLQWVSQLQGSTGTWYQNFSATKRVSELIGRKQHGVRTSITASTEPGYQNFSVRAE